MAAVEAIRDEETKMGKRPLGGALVEPTFYYFSRYFTSSQG